MTVVIKRILDRFYARELRGHKGAIVGRGVRVLGRPIVAIAPKAVLTIGDCTSLISRSEDTALGVAHPCVLRALPGAEITIGRDCGLSGVAIVASASVSIGGECLLGANVTVIDSDMHPIRARERRYSTEPVPCAPIVIEDNVFVGANSIILKGVTIGRDAVVGAGSVVTDDIPAGSIAAGNPARVIGRVPE